MYKFKVHRRRNLNSTTKVLRHVLKVFAINSTPTAQPIPSRYAYAMLKTLMKVNTKSYSRIAMARFPIRRNCTYPRRVVRTFGRCCERANTKNGRRIKVIRTGAIWKVWKRYGVSFVWNFRFFTVRFFIWLQLEQKDERFLFFS